MNKNLTDITMVIDRSGSMASIKDDAEGGINSFIEAQKKLPGKALLTLVQFDTDYEFVHRGVDINAVHSFQLHPRGSTALHDACGRAIAETGERLKAMAEDDRPGLVVFVIVTDGQENASHEWTLEKLREVIKTQQDTYAWQFTFLAANQDAFVTGGNMGVKTSGIANFADSNSKDAYEAASSNVARMRSASAGGQSVKNSYTDEERLAMSVDPKNKK